MDWGAALIKTGLGAIIGFFLGWPLSYIICFCQVINGSYNGPDLGNPWPTMIICGIIGVVIGFCTELFPALGDMERSRATAEAWKAEQEKRLEKEKLEATRQAKEEMKRKAKALEQEKLSRRYANSNTLKISVGKAVKSCSEQLKEILAVEIPPLHLTDDNDDHNQCLHTALITNIAATSFKV